MIRPKPRDWVPLILERIGGYEGSTEAYISTSGKGIKVEAKNYGELNLKVNAILADLLQKRLEVLPTSQEKPMTNDDWAEIRRMRELLLSLSYQSLRAPTSYSELTTKSRRLLGNSPDLRARLRP